MANVQDLRFEGFRVSAFMTPERGKKDQKSLSPYSNVSKLPLLGRTCPSVSTVIFALLYIGNRMLRLRGAAATVP